MWEKLINENQSPRSSQERNDIKKKKKNLKILNCLIKGISVIFSF